MSLFRRSLAWWRYEALNVWISDMWNNAHRWKVDFWSTVPLTGEGTLFHVAGMPSLWFLRCASRHHVLMAGDIELRRSRAQWLQVNAGIAQMVDGFYGYVELQKAQEAVPPPSQRIQAVPSPPQRILEHAIDFLALHLDRQASAMEAKTLLYYTAERYAEAKYIMDDWYFRQKSVTLGLDGPKTRLLRMANYPPTVWMVTPCVLAEGDYIIRFAANFYPQHRSSWFVLFPDASVYGGNLHESTLYRCRCETVTASDVAAFQGFLEQAPDDSTLFEVAEQFLQIRSGDGTASADDTASLNLTAALAMTLLAREVL